MDLTLYNIVVSQLTDTPDLSIVQKRMPVPETWPVVVKNVVTFRKQLQHFIVTDGTTEALCFTAVPEIQDKIASMELGTIIHLIGAETRFHDENKCYVVDFEDICTLKEYDSRIKEQAQAQEKRVAWLKEQGYIEETDYSTMAPSDEKAK